MAFFGIIIVMWLFILILIVIACAILFVFIPCLVFAIINLVNGIRHNWPRRNIVFLSITGTISIIFIIAICFYLVWRFGIYQDPYADGGSSSEISAAICYLLVQIK